MPSFVFAKGGIDFFRTACGRFRRIRPRSDLSSVPPSCGGSIPARRRVAACATADAMEQLMAFACLPPARRCRRGTPAAPSWRAQSTWTKKYANGGGARAFAAPAWLARRLPEENPLRGRYQSSVSVVRPVVDNRLSRVACLMSVRPCQSGQGATVGAPASPWPQMRQRVAPKGSIASAHRPPTGPSHRVEDRTIPAG